MATKDSISTKTKQVVWDLETADFFTIRLGEINAILTALISSVGEYKSDDRPSTDEVIVLVVQLVTAAILELERFSYDLDWDNGFNGEIGAGGLPLRLMWARASMDVIDDMFNTDSWRINLSGHVLAPYFGAVRRLIEQAITEAEEVHKRRFHKAA